MPTVDMELFIREWEPKIRGISVNAGIYGTDVDDCVQCVYEKIAKDHGLERYDPTRGAWSTYIYAVVLSEVRNFRTRLYRHRSRYYNSTSLSLDDKDFVECSPAELEHPIEEIHRSQFWDIVNEVRLALDDLFPVRSWAEIHLSNGEIERRPRSHLQVFDLLVQDFSRGEIAEFLDYSPQSVGLLIKQIAEVPEAVRLLHLWREV